MVLVMELVIRRSIPNSVTGIILNRFPKQFHRMAGFDGSPLLGAIEHGSKTLSKGEDKGDYFITEDPETDLSSIRSRSSPALHRWKPAMG